MDMERGVHAALDFGPDREIAPALVWIRARSGATRERKGEEREREAHAQFFVMSGQPTFCPVAQPFTALTTASRPREGP